MVEPLQAVRKEGAGDDDDNDRVPSRWVSRVEVVVAKGGLEPAVCCNVRWVVERGRKDDGGREEGRSRRS